MELRIEIQKIICLSSIFMFWNIMQNKAIDSRYHLFLQFKWQIQNPKMYCKTDGVFFSNFVTSLSFIWNISTSFRSFHKLLYKIF